MSSAFEGLPKTPNLKLNKPGYDNVADIEALNENADILDAEIQGIKNTFVKSVNGINAGDGGNVDLGIMPISQGGTGATTAEQARTNLGIKDIATYDVLPIANGGTGASTAKQARANLEVEPIGTIFAFAGNDIPSGYLPCNGGAISRTTYADLFAAIGTTYGVGDGSTTFNLPNLIDKFIQGSETVGTIKSAGLPNIEGFITDACCYDVNGTNVSAYANGAFYTDGYGIYMYSSRNIESVNFSNIHFDASRSSSIYGNSNTVQPPALTMRYIIKY